MLSSSSGLQFLDRILLQWPSCLSLKRPRTALAECVIQNITVRGGAFMLTVLERLTFVASVSLNYLANNTFYLIGSAVFQCMEYHWTTKVRQKTFYFSFFKVLAGLTRLTWTLRSWLEKVKWKKAVGRLKLLYSAFKKRADNSVRILEPGSFLMCVSCFIIWYCLTRHDSDGCRPVSEAHLVYSLRQGQVQSKLK
jgi:hypothetical protein